jgi:hypothetical protein
MENISVKRYANPEETGYKGWVEPDNLSWILFVALDDSVVLFDKRDPQTGAVIN